MIKTESEYKEAVKRRDSEIIQIEEYRKQLKDQNVSSEMIEKAVQLYESFRLGLVEEIEFYERNQKFPLY